MKLAIGVGVLLILMLMFLKLKKVGLKLIACVVAGVVIAHFAGYI